MDSELTIANLRYLYLAGKTTPAEVAEEIVRRAALYRHKNIWIAPPDMATMRPHLDRIKHLDPAACPLWGMPFAIKDNIDVAGFPTTAACPAFSYMPDASAYVVERVLAAGAFPVGKANLDQFATGLVGTRSPYGATRNALRDDLISGGSSSGSAVAVKTGQAAFSLGTDTAGSGRVPALLNGLYGFKPSLGAWSTRGVVPACQSLDCVTVFAHTAADCLAVDDAVRHYDIDCCWSRPISRAASRLPARVLVPREAPRFYGRYADGFRRGWEQAIRLLRSLPVAVEEIDSGLFSQAAALLYDGPWIAERWSDIGRFVEAHPEEILPVTKTILESGAGRDAAELFTAQHRLAGFRAEAHRLLRDSVLVLPTAGGTFTIDEVEEDPIATNSMMGLYTNHCNLLDLAALSVPTGWADTDVPYGVTVFSHPEEEHLLFGLAESLASGCEERMEIAVCGLHMRGMPLEQQLLDVGGVFQREAWTSEDYRMYCLGVRVAKPGMVRLPGRGATLPMEIWSVPCAGAGRFLSLIPSPLGLGRITLRDGDEVVGFVCEAWAIASAEDITQYGGWRRYIQSEISKTG